MIEEKPPDGPGNDSSTDLLRRFQDGDQLALSRLIARHRPAMARWARGRLPTWARDAIDTEDKDALIAAAATSGCGH